MTRYLAALAAALIVVVLLAVGMLAVPQQGEGCVLTRNVLTAGNRQAVVLYCSYRSASAPLLRPRPPVVNRSAS
jgi:hypothetical protein